MRTYSKNLLPADGSHYILHGAKLSNGHFIFSNTGGTITYVFSESDIKQLTEYLMLNCLIAPGSDEYIPDVIASIDIHTLHDKFFNYVCNLAADERGAFKTEIEVAAEEYNSFTLTFSASGPAVMTLWELRAEADTDSEAVIDGVRQSLPRLIYDFNTTQRIIGQHEEQIALITCKLLHDTDLQGHLLVNVTASTRCDTYLRIYDGIAEELYCPIKTTMNPGNNVIEVPHAFLKRNQGVHNFYVTLQATSGQLVAETRGILFTIDGGYLAERLSNPGMDIQDVAFKWPEGESEPSEIWAIGIDNEHVIVKKAAYSSDKNNSAWEAVYDLGKGLAAAIEFDGKWIRPTGEEYSNIITADLPTMAVITTDNRLQLYQNGTNEEPICMSENAKSPSLLRGYSSEEYPDKNQGLILAWIKDKKVFYKQYTYIIDSISWTQEEQLTEAEEAAEALFVQVHRLNDYRVGFLVQYDDKNKWYISDRTYVAQAVPKEAISTGLHGHIACSAPAVNFVTSITHETISTSAQGTCELFMFTAEEMELYTYVLIPNDLSEVTEPQDTFIITFENMHKIVPFSSSFLSNIEVSLYDVTLSKDKYSTYIQGPNVVIKLNEPSTGKINITWQAMRFNCYIDEKRYIKSTSIAGSFEWTIYTYCSTACSEVISTTTVGTIQASATCIEYVKENVPEPSTATLSGTIQLNATQIGDIPI